MDGSTLSLWIYIVYELWWLPFAIQYCPSVRPSVSQLMMIIVVIFHINQTTKPRPAVWHALFAAVVTWSGSETQEKLHFIRATHSLPWKEEVSCRHKGSISHIINCDVFALRVRLMEAIAALRESSGFTYFCLPWCHLDIYGGSWRLAPVYITFHFIPSQMNSNGFRQGHRGLWDFSQRHTLILGWL